MSDTNQHNHPELVQIGPATLALYDEVNDHLVSVGKVDDLVLAKEVDDAVLTEFINGVETEVDARPIAERYRLRGIFRETLNPNTQRLFVKNCGTPSTTGCTISSITERIQMFYGKQKILKVNAGFYGTGALLAATAVSGQTFGAGGTIPAGTYVFVVTPMYGGTEGAYVESAGVAVVLGDNVALVVTPPPGCTPDSYRIYVYDTALMETRADADLIHETSELNVWFSSWVRGAAYPGDQTSSFSVTGLGGAPTYLEGTDYSIDNLHAMLCLVDGGDIDDGEWLEVTYSFYVNATTTMTIGPSDVIPRYVHPVILSFKDDDRDTPIGRGFEMHLYRVVANAGWEWEMSKMEFNTGFAFDWRVLSDPRRLRHGDVHNYHRQFETYGLMDFSDLTEFTHQEDCAAPPPP